MSDKRPETEIMKISDVRGQLNKLVNRVYRKDSRIVVERNGVPVAGIVSAEDMERLARLDRDRDERRNVLEAMRTPFRDVPSEEVEAETDRIVSETRERDRQTRQRASSEGCP